MKYPQLFNNFQVHNGDVSLDFANSFFFFFSQMCMMCLNGKVDDKKGVYMWSVFLTAAMEGFLQSPAGG